MGSTSCEGSGSLVLDWGFLRRKCSVWRVPVMEQYGVRLLVHQSPRAEVTSLERPV